MQKSELRRSGRKRKNSSSTSSRRSSSPISHRTRQGTTTTTEQVKNGSAPCTPKASRKRVRFSDPGPQLLHGPNACSTGLTPAMQRTSFNSLTKPANATPSRKARRNSTPTVRSCRGFDCAEQCNEQPTSQVIQFVPLRQILDPRTQRRIRRIGLSDEINHIECEKRQASTFERTLQSLRCERDTLQKELNALRQQRKNAENQLPPDEPVWISSGVGDHEQGIGISQPFNEVPTAQGLDKDETVVSDGNGDNDDAFMLYDNAIINPRSPGFRGAENYLSPVPERILLSNQSHTNIPHEAQNSDCASTCDIHTLRIRLEAAKNEKKELFNTFRSRVSAFEGIGPNSILRQSSPPPDFFNDLISILTTALSRASDATQALEDISQECSNLGFSGTGAHEALADIQDHFRSARLELERAVPGETVGVGLEDGKATLSALVQRVRSLAKDLSSERKQHYGSLGREKALRGQFDNLLRRYEAAVEKIGNLEDRITSSASDMLHTRIRMQDLEAQDHEKATGIERLNAALDKYREDVGSLERLVSRLEDENHAAQKQYAQQISALREQVASERKQRSVAEITVSEYESRIQQLEETVQQNRVRACDLTAEVEALEKEHQKALNIIKQQTQANSQQHNEEIGILNVRISNLTTSLEGVRSEAQRLRQINNGLEHQLRMECESRDELLDRWAREQARSFAFMKETVNSERRRARVRAANWELNSDDLMSDGTTMMGSEPITPVSMTRFVDVEVGRGKNRRRMDSGIGILSEEDLLVDDDTCDTQIGLDSDVDLPVSGLVD